MIVVDVGVSALHPCILYAAVSFALGLGWLTLYPWFSMDLGGLMVVTVVRRYQIGGVPWRLLLGGISWALYHIPDSNRN